MSPDQPALKPVTLRFRDAQVEAGFRAAEDGRTVRSLRVALLVAGGLLPLMGAVVDIAAPPAIRGGQSMFAVTLLGCVFLAAGYAATFAPSFVRHPDVAVAVMSIVYAAVIALGLRQLPTEFAVNRGFMLLMPHLFTINGLLRLRVVPAVVASTLAIAAYGLILLLLDVIAPVAIARQVFWLLATNIWATWICYQLDLGMRREFAARAALDRERARAEGLLLNILPAAIAARLKDSHESIAEHRENVTVLFADLVGFTPLSARKTAADLVALLDRVFTGFDALAREHGLEKIKTIGDAYMAVAGLPQPHADHAQRAARTAIAMLGVVQKIATETGEALQLRVGLHSGAVVAGVIGRSKFSYDLWGDTVNTASRMESTGVADTVHCSAATAVLLAGEFAVQSRGEIEVKGKGTMETFLLSPR